MCVHCTREALDQASRDVLTGGCLPIARPVLLRMRVKTPVSQLNLRATSPENSATYEHTCPHISLVWESATDLVAKRMGAHLTHQGMLSPHVPTEGCSSFPDSEGRRPGDRGAPYRTLLLPPLLLPLLLLLLPLLQNVSRPASSSAVRVVAARPRVSTKAHFYEAGQWRFRGCRAGRGAPGQGRAGRVRSALPAAPTLYLDQGMGQG